MFLILFLRASDGLTDTESEIESDSDHEHDGLDAKRKDRKSKKDTSEKAGTLTNFLCFHYAFLNCGASIMVIIVAVLSITVSCVLFFQNIFD